MNKVFYTILKSDYLLRLIHIIMCMDMLQPTNYFPSNYCL